MNAEAIEFSVDGQKLRGKFFPAKAPAKKLVFLFLHGWTGIPNEGAAAVMAENGFSSMTFSLSGHGDSDGRIEDQTREKSLREVLAAYDLLKKKLPADAKIAVVGTSYGSYMAVLLSVERAVVALLLRVPANYKDERFNEIQMRQGHEDPAVTQWRQQKLDYNATKALRALHNFEGRVQIIEAGEDELVPHQTIQNYIDAVADKSQLDYHLMKGWPHSLGADPARNKQYQEMLLAWAQN